MEKLLKVQKDRDEFLKVSFPYNPKIVQKIKNIEGKRWHPEEKYCLPAASLWQAGSFPDDNGTLAACGHAKIVKKVTVHSLRHSFATHLLESGVDLSYTPHFSLCITCI